VTTVNSVKVTRSRGDRPLGEKRPKTERSRGQILVLFVMAIFVFVGMVALVIDVSWFWVNSLRVQRAADAAALAGVVRLPSDAPGAYVLARAEAKKNGYDDASAAITITPLQDPLVTGRRLVVTVSAPVDMFFMRLFGFNQIMATRTARAEFVLPVPMGSPQQWYGVGTFDKVKATQQPDVPGATTNTGWETQTSFPATVWTNPARADANDNNSFAVSPVTNNSAQQWGTFGLTSGGSAIPSGAVIEGIEVRFRALATGSGLATTCRIRTDIAYNNAPTYTTTPVDQTITTTEALYTLGSSSSLAAWPRPGAPPQWQFSSFTDANFRVRLTWNKPNANCGGLRTVSVDTLEVRVTYHPMLPGPITYSPDNNVPVPTPAGETVAPTSQGFWGAVFTGGGVRRNGDRYSPHWYFSGSSALNTEQIVSGYDYTVEIKGTNGRVHLFDPVFCATGRNPAGSGNYGAGDHWTDLPASGGVTNGPVTTEFTLFDTNGSILDKTNDTVVGSPLIYTTRASDQSGEFDDWLVGGPGAGDVPTAAPVTPCASDPAIVAAHNQWVDLATALATGVYRVNVKTSQAGNDATGAENLWSIYVGADGAAGSARVYGDAKMVAYSNLTGAAATQKFYLAQIEKQHAGKTMEIRLFDPGDVAGNATLRILSPDGGSYNYATFSYVADAQCNAGTSDVCSAANRTFINTAVGGASSFDNTVITISIPLPSSYGSVSTKPPGETEDGWWKIEYTVGAANDTTTWEVSIRGNPVHLIVP
jgi:Flp pilus assembly protein TadG